MAAVDSDTPPASPASSFEPRPVSTQFETDLSRRTSRAKSETVTAPTQRLRAPRAPPTSGGSILTEKRRKVGDGFQEQLRVHRLVRRQRLELVVQQKSHGPAVWGKKERKKRRVARQSRAALALQRTRNSFFFFPFQMGGEATAAPITFVLLQQVGNSTQARGKAPTHEHDNELVEV